MASHRFSIKRVSQPQHRDKQGVMAYVPTLLWPLLLALLMSIPLVMAFFATPVLSR